VVVQALSRSTSPNRLSFAVEAQRRVSRVRNSMVPGVSFDRSFTVTAPTTSSSSGGFLAVPEGEGMDFRRTMSAPASPRLPHVPRASFED
jgi:hypothetical protein